MHLFRQKTESGGAIRFNDAIRPTLSWDKSEAEAEVVVAVRRVVVVAVRHLAVPGVVVPAAATVHAVRA